VKIKIKPKDTRFNQFLIYSSYKLGLGRYLFCKYRHQECIGACNSYLCNKDEIFYMQYRFFFLFLNVFMLQFDHFHFFLFFLAQICIQASLNARWRLSDAFKPFKINESLINTKAAIK
jgi:hypothetical protein